MFTSLKGFVILSQVRRQGAKLSEGSAVASSRVPRMPGPGSPRPGLRPWIGRRQGTAMNPISDGLVLFLKSALSLLLAIAVCFSLGASDSSARFNDMGHRLMCTCGCAQLLGECNHVGCTASGTMRNELAAAIASGATDKEILASFAAKYGATVLAAPPTHGFSLVAWIAPIAVFAAALLGTILLVRQWSVGRAAVPASVDDPSIDALRERIRRETDADLSGGI